MRMPGPAQILQLHQALRGYARPGGGLLPQRSLYPEAKLTGGQAAPQQHCNSCCHPVSRGPRAPCSCAPSPGERRGDRLRQASQTCWQSSGRGRHRKGRTLDLESRALWSEVRGPGSRPENAPDSPFSPPNPAQLPLSQDPS